VRGSERPCELGDYCGVMPDSLDDTGETFPGGGVSGNVCVSVESDQVEGLGAAGGGLHAPDHPWSSTSRIVTGFCRGLRCPRSWRCRRRLTSPTSAP